MPKPRGGRGGKRKPPGRGHRHMASASEVIARNMMRSDSSSSSSDEVEEEVINGEAENEEKGEQVLTGQPASTDKAEEEGTNSGAENEEDAMPFKTYNPNQDPSQQRNAGMTRREREQKQREKHDKMLDKLMAEGKTAAAKADLARLAEVRARREANAKSRGQEKTVNDNSTSGASLL